MLLQSNALLLLASPLHDEIDSHLRYRSDGEGSSEVLRKECLLHRLRREAGS